MYRHRLTSRSPNGPPCSGLIASKTATVEPYESRIGQQSTDRVENPVSRSTSRLKRSSAYL